MMLRSVIIICAMLLSDLTSPVWAQGIQGFAYQTLGCTSCQDWRVSGVCFWLKCSMTGCRIKSSIRVSHNIPDVMIASFNGVSPLGLLYGMPTDGAVSAHGQGRSIIKMWRSLVIPLYLSTSSYGIPQASFAHLKLNPLSPITTRHYLSD